MENQNSVSLMASSGDIPVTGETIKKYLCDKATEQDLALVLSICRNTGMNPFIGDVNIIKYAKDQPAQIVTRKDWFFKTANKQPDYEGMDHGIIVSRDGNIVYQEGAFMSPTDKLLGGWASVYRKDKRPHRAEVTLAEYSKGQSNWRSMPATMINKVAKVHALRESFPEKFQGVYDESELDSMKNSALVEGPVSKEQADEIKHKAEALGVSDKLLNALSISSFDDIPSSKYDWCLNKLGATEKANEGG